VRQREREREREGERGREGQRRIEGGRERESDTEGGARERKREGVLFISSIADFQWPPHVLDS